MKKILFVKNYIPFIHNIKKPLLHVEFEKKNYFPKKIYNIKIMLNMEEFNSANMKIQDEYDNTKGGINNRRIPIVTVVGRGNVGKSTLVNNTTGYSNTAVGYESLYANTTGYNNTAVGFNALYANTTGVHNTAYGYQSVACKAYQAACTEDGGWPDHRAACWHCSRRSCCCWECGFCAPPPWRRSGGA